MKTVRISWEGGTVTGRLTGSGATGILLAHGAGTNQDHPLMVSLRDGLGEHGFTVMTFNYPYTERGSKRPDSTSRLVSCHASAASYLEERSERLFLAGRSMGGRMSTYLVADGYRAPRGLVLYSYPLHPAGRPERIRAGHLQDVGLPMLFFRGSRDALSKPELFARHVAHLPGVTVIEMDGADHSYRGRSWGIEKAVPFLVAGTAGWIDSLSSGKTRD